MTPHPQLNLQYFISFVFSANWLLYPWFKLFPLLNIPAAFSLDTEQPDYDLDSEDDAFVNKLKKKMEISFLQFEEMIDRLEKGSGQQVGTVYVSICTQNTASCKERPVKYLIDQSTMSFWKMVVPELNSW